MGTSANNRYRAHTLGHQSGPWRPAGHRPWPFTAARLAEWLASVGAISLGTARRLVDDAQERAMSFVDLAIARGSVSADTMKRALGAAFGLPEAELSTGIDPNAIRLVPSAVAIEHHVFPMRCEGTRLVLAVADPTLEAPLRELHGSTGMTLDLRLASRQAIDELVARHYLATLTVASSGGAVQQYSLPRGTITIGRTAGNDVVVDDTWVSGTHAVVRWDPSGYWITDLGSRNGVFVNGVRISGSVQLTHEDLVQIGLTTLRISLPLSERACGDPSRTQVALGAGALGVGSESHQARIAPPDAATPAPSTASPPEPTSKEPRVASARIRAARIEFAGRVIAQMLAALVAFLLGMYLLGGLPSQCSVGQTLGASTGESGMSRASR